MKLLMTTGSQEPTATWTQRIGIILIIGLLAGYAWSNRFTQDDAFISLRYAKNLVDGIGLTWNPGDYIEGYTNFLWTLLSAIPLALGIEPVQAMFMVGIVLFVCSLLMTYQLAHKILGSVSAGVAAIILCGANYTFSAYATGGLETQLQTFLITASLYFFFAISTSIQKNRMHEILFSLSVTSAILTRLDSLLIVGPILLALVYRIVSHQRRQDTTWLAPLFRVITVPTVVLVCWFTWKMNYYGNLLPNTYYAKASSISAPLLERGVFYCYTFLTTYWLLPFIFLIPFVYKKARQAPFWPTTVLSSLLIIWVLYLIKVGGDFMEFRFFVPVMPLMFILVLWVIYRVIETPLLRVSMMAALIIGSVAHAVTFSKIEYLMGIEAPGHLYDKLNAPEYNWIGIGSKLGEMFGPVRPKVSIATTAAGAIPFYSNLPTVDMLGLNDSWIARNGRFCGTKPGHEKIATTEYLLSRKVNLVIGHPQMRKHDDVPIDHVSIQNVADMFLLDTVSAPIPDQARIVVIPIDDTYELLTLYLTPHHDIDRIIRDHQLRTIPIVGGYSDNAIAADAQGYRRMIE